MDGCVDAWMPRYITVRREKRKKKKGKKKERAVGAEWTGVEH